MVIFYRIKIPKKEGQKREDTYNASNVIAETKGYRNTLGVDQE